MKNLIIFNKILLPLAFNKYSDILNKLFIKY